MHLIWIHEWISACRWWTSAARQRFRGGWFIYERAATSGSWFEEKISIDLHQPTYTSLEKGFWGWQKFSDILAGKFSPIFSFSSFKLVLAFSRESADAIWLFLQACRQHQLSNCIEPFLISSSLRALSNFEIFKHRHFTWTHKKVALKPKSQRYGADELKILN